MSLAELHPLEGTIASMLTADMWRDLKDGEGRIIDKQYVLKVSGEGGGGKEKGREVEEREREAGFYSGVKSTFTVAMVERERERE